KQVVATESVPPLKRLIDAYWSEVTPHKEDQGQLNDRRCHWLWVRVLGEQFDVRQLTLARWTDFIARRASGELDAHGEVVPKVEDRQPVSLGTVRADLQWLRSLLRFGMASKDEFGRRLLPGENPTLGYPLPSEPDVKRPVATTTRYEQLMKVA